MTQKTLGRVFKFLALLPFSLLMSACQGIPLLDPKGPIGAQERDLMLMSVGLGMIVIIPVLVMAIWFTLRYRESNKKATYKPHWEGNLKLETVIWGIPILIIAVLSYLTWVKTSELDPYKPIPSTEKTVKVQVISTDWNWIFLYPEYNVATVNSLVIPAQAPVSFDMTSASVMTSLFIPHLGSQMYIMAGMVSHLNLLASEPGSYTGHNMEYSGEGYDSMHFVTKAVSKEEFEAWVKANQGAGANLTGELFDQLSKPQKGLPATVYGSVEPKLFERVVSHFMPPQGSVSEEKMDKPMNMDSSEMTTTTTK